MQIKAQNILVFLPVAGHKPTVFENNGTSTKELQTPFSII